MTALVKTLGCKWEKCAWAAGTLVRPLLCQKMKPSCSLRRQGGLPGGGGTHNPLPWRNPEKQTGEPKWTHGSLEDFSHEHGQATSTWASACSYIFTYCFSVVNSVGQSGGHSPPWVILGEEVMASRKGGILPRCLLAISYTSFSLNIISLELPSLLFQVRLASLLSASIATCTSPETFELLKLLFHLIPIRLLIPREQGVSLSLCLSPVPSWVPGFYIRNTQIHWLVG